jgi:hypothetical protein
MTEENERSLMLTKFFSLNKKKQAQIIGLLMDANSDSDSWIALMDYKPTEHKDKKIKEGDWIKIPIGISNYPKLNRKYYEDKDLLDENERIKVKVIIVNPFTKYVYVSAVVENLTIESTIKLYPSYIPEQEDLFEL